VNVFSYYFVGEVVCPEGTNHPHEAFEFNCLKMIELKWWRGTQCPTVVPIIVDFELLCFFPPAKEVKIVPGLNEGTLMPWRVSWILIKINPWDAVRILVAILVVWTVVCI
jgi:hypothetical protein